MLDKERIKNLEERKHECEFLITAKELTIKGALLTLKETIDIAVEETKIGDNYNLMANIREGAEDIIGCEASLKAYRAALGEINNAIAIIKTLQEHCE